VVPGGVSFDEGIHSSFLTEKKRHFLVVFVLFCTVLVLIDK